MEIQLSNSEKAKIFAMYLGCDVSINLAPSITERLAGLTIMFGGYHALFAPRCNEAVPVNDCKLLLKSLEDITDEDALMCGKIWHDDYDWVIKERYSDFIFIECDDYKMWIWCDMPLFEICCEEKYSGIENIEAHGGESETTNCENVIDIIDFLREKGYMLPYKGQSLFELGIAINTATLTQNQKP